MTDKLKPVDLARARLQHHREQVKYWAGRLHTAERNAGLTRRPRLPAEFRLVDSPAQVEAIEALRRDVAEAMGVPAELLRSRDGE